MKPDAEATANLGVDRSEWPEVAIIVLNWNNYEDTVECLASLEQIEYPNHRVILVDNGSSDGSGELLEDEFEWCEFILNEENLGFAAGNNVGIKRGLEEGVDYVFLLNNDMVLEDNALTLLVETAEKYERAKIVSGVITYANSDKVWYAGGELNLLTARTTVLDNIPKCEEYETGFVTGAMMLLSAEFLNQTGGLNEKYFFGGEDKEISQRCLDEGKKLMVNSNSKASHKVSSTSGKRNSFNYYHSTLNRLMFSRSHLTGTQLYLFYLFFVCSRVFRFSEWLISGQKNLVLITLLACFDYLNGDTSKKRTELLSRQPKTSYLALQT